MVVNVLLCFIIFFPSLKEKKYHYTVVSGTAFLYFLSTWLQSNIQNNVNVDAYSLIFGWIQKIMLLFLAGYMIYVSFRSSERKTDFPAAIFAIIACISRFLRSWIFDLYTAEMQIPGADVQAVYQEFSGYYVVADSVAKFSVVVMLVLIAWHMGKPRETRN